MRHYYIAILLLLSCFAVEARLGAIDESPSRGLLNFATEYSPGKSRCQTGIFSWHLSLTEALCPSLVGLDLH